MSFALRKPRTFDPEHFVIDEAQGAKDEVGEFDDGLLTVAGPIMVICYSLLFTTAAFAFMGSGNSLFAVAISAAFAVVYFAIPILFLRIRAARDQRWHRDASVATNPVVEVWTGSIRRREAIAQIVSIPLAILMGFVLLSFRWSLL